MNTRTKSTSRKTKKTTGSEEWAQYVVPLGGTGWLVKDSRAKKFTVITDNKREAVMIARSIAKRKGTALVVHARDGSVQERTSYAV